ncbi:MAG: GIY-YIG nuclease family protein [Candidatus Spechtbacteria bacterium]|nr:GIY-YIG nuclease family protein [Candidatus Spechtbacteria bacterium]
MYYVVYVLENQLDKSWYIGFTANVDARLAQHNEGRGGKTTRDKLHGGLTDGFDKIWKRIYCETYINKKDALGREQFLKSGSGRKFLKKQIRYYLEERQT